MTELLPCPQCRVMPRFISGTQRDGKYVAVVMPQCDCASVKWADSDEEAITWWNALPRHTGEQRPEGMSRSQSRRIAIQTDLPEFVYVYAESAAKYETLSCSKSPNVYMDGAIARY